MGRFSIRNATKILRSASGVIFGRKTAGTGAGEELSPDDVRTLLSVYTVSQTDSAISAAVASLVDSSPATLDTLNELAAALGDDANFATTVTTALADKASISHTHAASDITSGTVATARLGSGTADSTKRLAGDNTWVAAGIGGSTGGTDLAVIAANGTAGATVQSIPALTVASNGQLTNTYVGYGGARTLARFVNTDGVCGMIHTTNGYNLVVEPYQTHDLYLGTGTASGGGHATYIRGGETYQTKALFTHAICIQSGSRYASSTVAEFDLKSSTHILTGGTESPAYCAGAVFRTQTISGQSGTHTVTDASTLRIEGAPIAGANAVLTNSWSLHVVAGASKFGGGLLADKTGVTAYTVGTLPSASAWSGYTSRVTDSSVAASGNYGATVAGGGGNKVKIWSDGTNWIIA